MAKKKEEKVVVPVEAVPTTQVPALDADGFSVAE